MKTNTITYHTSMVKNCQEQINRATVAYQHDDEYKRLADLKATTESAMQKIRYNYQENNRENIERLRRLMKAHREAILELKRSKKPVVPPEVKEWFDTTMHYGIDYGYKDIEIVWVSPKGKYVIIRHPGQTTGQGTPMGSSAYYYASTQHWLHTVGDGPLDDRKFVTEGRLKKHRKQEMMDYAVQDETIGE